MCSFSPESRLPPRQTDHGLRASPSRAADQIEADVGDRNRPPAHSHSIAQTLVTLKQSVDSIEHIAASRRLVCTV
jgi:hypothetical protein